MGVADSHFVGRAEPLGLLEEAWATQAVRGRPVTWVVSGEAGVGKTRLVGEFASRAQARGATALAGGCVDLGDAAPPLWPFVEALRGYARRLDEATRTELLGGEDSELGRVLPELGEGGRMPGTAAGPSAQARLFELLLALLGRVAERSPLLLVVEDLHWADRSTRDLLAFLTRSLHGERLMVVATVRSDELYRGHPVRPFLAELYRARAVRRLELAAFSREELGEHLSGLAGEPVDPAVLDSVYERSEGNAFFAEELVAAWREGGREELPSTLRDILLARVERRSAAAQEVLRVAAVGGRRVPVDLLEQVCDLPGRACLEALRELVAHQLLIADGDGCAFRHALLREAVYEELLPGERGRLHAGYGTALSERPAAEAAAAELAYHWYAAHELPRALAASVQAGLAAADRWGFSEAGTHFERALELWDRVPEPEARAGRDYLTLAREAAEAANLAGDHVRAARLIGAAIERADPDRAGLLHERLGRYLWAAGDSDAALRAYEEALSLVPEAPPSAARARVLAAHGQALMLLARFEAAGARCREAIAIARDVGARAEEGHALNTLGCALAFLGQPEAAVEHLSQARDIASEVGDLDDLGRAYQNLSEVLGGPLNRLDEALEVALEGRWVTERVGLARDYGVSLEVNAATALLAAGRWDEADEILRAAEARRPRDMAEVEVHLCRARLDVARGGYERAMRHLRRAEHLITKALDPQFHSVACARRAELLLWQRRPAEARETVAQGLRSLAGSDDAWFAGPLLWLGAWAEADTGGSAGALLQEAERLTTPAPGRFVSPVTAAYARLGRAEARRAEPDAWAAAAEAWRAVGHPYPEAYARWREAEALLARRQARQGVAALRAALDLAERLGARPLAEEVAALARRARVDLPVPAPDASAAEDPAARLGITRRERQVLQLIAAGRTNREIARELFVTEKTAGAHVSSILAKLRVRGRVEAATAAHRLGLLD